MTDVSAFMLLKVLGIAALGGAFVWWQFRDLAREKSRSEQKRSEARRAEDAQAAPSPSAGDPPPS